MRELRLITYANAIIAEAKAHFHLRRFKAAQIFRKVVVSFAQDFAKHHSIGGCFASSSCSMRKAAALAIGHLINSASSFPKSNAKSWMRPLRNSTFA